MKATQKKSLIFSEIFPPMHGGSGRWLWEVYSRMSDKKYQFLAGAVEGDQDFDKKQSFMIDRVKFDYSCWSDWGLMSIRSWIFYIKLFFATYKIVKRDNINVIHCGRCIPEGVIAFMLKKLLSIEYVVFIHGEDVENAATSRSLTYIVKRVLQNADLLICNSKNSKRVLTAHWDVDITKVIIEYPGVDTEKFKPADKNPTVRNNLGWSNRPTVLTVSRLEERKGHSNLIKALVNIKKEIPNILYAIVGGGPEKQKLEQLVETLKLEENVIFMSEIDDEIMLQCYQQADLFVLPNRDIGRNIEGFGIVMIEAQACGLPVIGGNSGGTPETIIDGETGIIVDARNIKELENAVKSSLLNKNSSIESDIRRKKWCDEFSWDNLTEKLTSRLRAYKLD